MTNSESLKSQREKLLKISKQERNKAYYEKVKQNKRTCEICCCQVTPSYWDKHLTTSRHEKFERLQESLKPKPQAPVLKKRGRPPKSKPPVTSSS